MLFVVCHSLAVHKGNGVHNKVTMQVLRVQVRCYYDLKAVAPYTLGKLHSDLLSKVGIDIRLVLEAQIAVIGLDAVLLVELFLDRHKLVTGS